MSLQHALPRSRDVPVAHAGGEPTLAHDLDNIYRLTATAPTPAPAKAPIPDRPATKSPMSTRDLTSALDMLTRAAKAMALMEARYQHVEDYAKDLAERAEKDIADARSEVQAWEARAMRSEAEIAILRERVREVERVADAAEQEASEAREWLQCYYDKIVGSFHASALFEAQAA